MSPLPPLLGWGYSLLHSSLLNPSFFSCPLQTLGQGTHSVSCFDQGCLLTLAA